jgi:hypothetical protein
MNKTGFNLPLSLQEFNDAVKNIAKSTQKTTEVLDNAIPGQKLTACFSISAIKIVCNHYKSAHEFCNANDLIYSATCLTDSVRVISEDDLKTNDYGKFTAPVFIVSEIKTFSGGTDWISEEEDMNNIIMTQTIELKIEVL